MLYLSGIFILSYLNECLFVFNLFFYEILMFKWTNDSLLTLNSLGFVCILSWTLNFFSCKWNTWTLRIWFNLKHKKKKKIERVSFYIVPSRRVFYFPFSNSAWTISNAVLKVRSWCYDSKFVRCKAIRDF